MIALVALLLVQDAVMPAGRVEIALRAAPAVRLEFDREMLDYPTARFRDVRVTVNTATEVERAYFCGFVNGKNRMGAYSGWSEFVATEGFLVIADDSLSRDLVNMACHGPAIAQDTYDRSALLTHR